MSTFADDLEAARYEQARQRWRAMSWQERNAEQERWLRELACPTCGRNMVEAGKVDPRQPWWNARAVYCSNACRQKAHRQRRRNDSGLEGRIRNAARGRAMCDRCESCGEPAADIEDLPEAGR